MIPYWILFVTPAWVALLSPPLKSLLADGTRRLRVDGVWILIIVTLTMVVGFRYEVGGDWGSYLLYFSNAKDLNFGSIAGNGVTGDPGFIAINLFSFHFNLGISGVNTISALIFSFGLVLFCRNLPRPWLALACAIPYLVIVVSMGYTRQSIALGLLMVGFVMLSRSRYKAFVVWVLVAALFHKSAVLMIPIAAFSISRNRLLGVLIVCIGTVLGVTVLLLENYASLVHFYNDKYFQSSGASIRLAMNAVPAVLFLLYRGKYRLGLSEKKLWTVISLISIGMFIGFFVSDLSTALDRVALYLIPLQLVSFAYLPDAIGRSGGLNQVIVAGILIYYAAVMFIWLNFATHSGYWLPYQVGVVW
jgi:hypothetical protein